MNQSIADPKATKHPGKLTLIALGAALMLFTVQSASAQISDNQVGAKVAATAGPEDFGTNRFELIDTGVISERLEAYNVNDRNDYAYSRVFVQADEAAYGASSFAAGVATSYTAISKSFVFTAQSAGNYVLDTSLYAGSLDTSRGGDATGSGRAGISWNLTVDGRTLQWAEITTSFDGSQGSVTKNGTVNFDGYNSLANGQGSVASWNSTTISSDLGFLSAGQSQQFSFNMSTYAHTDYTGYSSELGLSCYGNIATTEYLSTGCGSSTVSFGDPSIFSGGNSDPYNSNLAYLSQAVINPVLVSAVPEPGEWAMMIAGLFVVGIMSRKRATSRL
jgi:hypothetical protein